jgi:hypothetical protein
MYDGTDDPEEYLTQFYLLSELNNWNTYTKALFLASNTLKPPPKNWGMSI